MLLVAILFAVRVRAQDCTDCELTLHEVVRLGDREGPGALRTLETVVRTDSRGRFFATRSSATEILVFDERGSLIRVLGRRGDGPGEFRKALGITVGPGDSLYVFDNAVARLTVFDPELRIARMNPVAPTPGVEILALDNGRFVAALPVNTTDRAGYPLHLMDAEGAIVKSFGSLTREFGPGFQQTVGRTIALARDGTIWAAHPFRYEITAWDTTNAQRAYIARQPDWFPPRPDTPRRAGNEPRPPEPFVRSVREMEDGTLWVALSVSDPNWRDGWRRNPDTGLLRIDEIRYNDSIIEVLDRDGRLLAHTRLDGIVTGLLPDYRVVEAIEDADAIPHLRILQRVR